MDDGGQSRLYEWQVGAEPTPVRDVVLPKEHGAGEGLMVDVSSSRLLVSMDGGHIGTTPCKDRPIDTRSFVIETVEK